MGAGTMNLSAVVDAIGMGLYLMMLALLCVTVLFAARAYFRHNFSHSHTDKKRR